MKGSVLALTILLFVVANSEAQESPGHELSDFVAANDEFGRHLLEQVQRLDPNKNVALSPLPISYIFGAIVAGSVSGATIQEINQAFGWKGGVNEGASRLLLERFRPPLPPPLRTDSKGRSEIRNKNRNPPPRSSNLWMKTAFIYRGRNTIYDSFLQQASRDFGLQIVNIEGPKSVDTEAAQWWSDDVPKPAVIGPSDFYSAGMMHLQDVWRGNTFSYTRKGDFFLTPRDRETVDVMPSEMESFRHAENKHFEAIDLRCWTVYLTVVLPGEGMDILQLENELAENPGELDSAMKYEPGEVELPKIRMQLDVDLTPALQQMGVQQVFTNLDVVKVPDSRLKHVVQKIDLEVNEQGIRANAGTVANGVYGGVMGAAIPFHMTVNRPFLFLIRDNLTDSLLFLGEVFNPAIHD
jgi:serine protease inhibitor